MDNINNMMFLALREEGKLAIEGESLDDKHLNEIELNDWNWGLTNKAPHRLKDKSGTKLSQVEPIKVEKMFDKASTALAKYCALGKPIPEGTITCRKRDGDQMREYLTIELRDIKVESVTWGAKGEDLRGIPETVELSFLKFSILYTMQDNDGHLLGVNTFDWDVAKHEEG